MSGFWNSPIAWPDLLCAHQPEARQNAVLHVLTASFLTVLPWRVFGITSYWAIANDIWISCRIIEYKMTTTFMLLVMLCCQAALPFVYLWVVGHQNLCASTSKVVSSLQKDMQAMLQANATLKVHINVVSNSAMDAAAPPCSLMPSKRPRIEDDKAEVASTDAGTARKHHAGAEKQGVRPTEADLARSSPNSGMPCVHIDEEAHQHQQPLHKPAAIPELSAASEMSGEAAPD